jgi:hypothetical protein
MVDRGRILTDLGCFSVHVAPIKKCCDEFEATDGTDNWKQLV